MRFDFITIGGAVEDITLYTDEDVLINNKKDVLRQKLIGFEYGAKIVIKKYESFFGGGAANTAVCFSHLGFKTGILTCLGADARGKKLKEHFKAEKISLELVKTLRGKPTGFSTVVVGHDNEHIIFTVRGANEDLTLNFLERNILNNSSRVHITSLNGKWEELLKKLFVIDKAKISWNPGSEQLKAGVSKLGKFLKKTNILLVNKDEAIELAISAKMYKNKGAKFLNDEKNLLKALKGFGPEVVVITSGKNGADVYDGENFYYKDSLMDPKKVIDTTGVGDAFSASFVAGYEKYKGDIKKAMNLGMRNAASVLKKSGAQKGLVNFKF